MSKNQVTVENSPQSVQTFAEYYLDSQNIKQLILVNSIVLQNKTCPM